MPCLLGRSALSIGHVGLALSVLVCTALRCGSSTLQFMQLVFFIFSFFFFFPLHAGVTLRYGCVRAGFESIPHMDCLLCTSQNHGMHGLLDSGLSGWLAPLLDRWAEFQGTQGALLRSLCMLQHFVCFIFSVSAVVLSARRQARVRNQWTRIESNRVEPRRTEKLGQATSRVVRAREGFVRPIIALR